MRTRSRLGKRLAADGVLYGTVNKYRERVGFEYAAQTPAAVAFTLNFVDEHQDRSCGPAKYAREQKALSENIFDLPNFHLEQRPLGARARYRAGGH